MKQSPQIQARIDTIAKELASGKERAEILRIYAKKWQIAERTIDRYLKPAKIVAKELTNMANEALNGVYVATMGEAAKNGLRSVLEVDTKLQEIIFDAPGKSDQLKAIDLYYKRNGLYAPDKIAATDKDGNDVKYYEETHVMAILKKINK